MANLAQVRQHAEAVQQPITHWHVDERDKALKAIVVHPSGKLQDVAWCPQEGSQKAFLSCPVGEVLYCGTRGPGKGLPLAAGVYCPEGRREIGSLGVGDKVLSPNGGTAKVIGVFPQGERPCYELTFRDGRKAVCDDQHKWAVKNGSGWVTWEMPKLLKAFRDNPKTSYYIPTTEPLDYGGSLPIVDPYLLGLLLGDGTFRASGALSFCTVDDELAQFVLSQGFNEVKPDSRNEVRYFTMSKYHPVAEEINSLGLAGKVSDSKFVPKAFLETNLESRLALLQGLMDTDGSTSSQDSTCEFGSASEQLVKDVVFLAHSLGAIATCKGSGRRFRSLLQFGNKVNPFRLSRKRDAKRPHQHESLSLRIEDIRETTAQETVCIKLDSEDGLFVTDDFVVTHNTDALLMDFCQHVGQGYGKEWRGILFRRTYPELTDVIEKSKKWIPLIFPQAEYNEAKSFWSFPDGEKLYFRHFAKPTDYWSYHGHAYPWIGWEELTTWADDRCYKSMMSCNRSTKPGIPLKIRATTNPYGIGHNWVKLRFRLPVPPDNKNGIGRYITDSYDQDGELEPPRIAIHGKLTENRILLHAQPDYVQKLRSAARNPAELDAWLNGSWDIVAGGMFDDVWCKVKNAAVLRPFDIPESWTIDRSFDWGSSKPFSVGWWAESDGSDVRLPNGEYRSTVRGDLFRIHEWYGWAGQPNEGLRLLASDIAQGIISRELKWGIHGRVIPGPADSSIFDEENGNSIAEDMADDVRIDGQVYSGVEWERADKSPGSRKQGWEQIRKMLNNCIKPENSIREHPGVFIFDNCDQWLRTMPTLPRADKDLDDVDTDSEDHIGDETRYRLRFERFTTKGGKAKGMY